MYLNWKQINPYNRESNLDSVTEKAGVYVILSKQENNTYKVIYVGQASNLQSRLKYHLSDNEKNKCIKNCLDKCSLKAVYAEVSSQSDRNGIELFLYNKFNPCCNDRTPPGDKEIKVNLW